jgi:hypothetical protein
MLRAERLHYLTHMSVPPCDQNIARSIVRMNRLSHAFYLISLAVRIDLETEIAGQW